MKLLKCLFALSFLAVSSVLFAAPTMDSVEYVLDPAQEGGVLQGGDGSMTVEEHTDAGYELGRGTILRLNYKMTTVMGVFEGYIKVFVPGDLDAIHEPSPAVKKYGAFEISKLADRDTVRGVPCTMLKLYNLKHPYEANVGEAKVLKIFQDETGRKKKIKDLKEKPKDPPKKGNG